MSYVGKNNKVFTLFHLSLTQHVKMCKLFVPVTLRKFSGYLRSATSFMKKCAKGESKTILSVSIRSADKMVVKLFCKNKNKSDRRRFIASGNCAITGKKSASKCWPKMISQMTAVANVTESTNKLPLLCW